MYRLLAVCAITIAIMIPSEAKESLFYHPIRSNNVQALRSLIRSSGVNTRDDDGNTPLLYAAAVGSSESMQLLLNAGANPNAANRVGATPLMWSAGDLAKVKLLLAKGANVNARAKSGRTPLHCAAYYDGNDAVVKLLIAKGADAKARDKGGASVLEVAAIGKNSVEVARLLLSHGAIANTADVAGMTPLLMASGIGNGNGNMVKLLLEHGASVKAKCIETLEIVKNGKIRLGYITALHQAASMGNLEAVEALVDAGADVNAMDVRKYTPLVWAVATDHPDPKIVQLLLDKGADPKPALEWARRYQNPAILPLLGLSAGNSVHATAPGSATAISSERVKACVAKALAGSQRPSANFFKSGGCVSCHAQNINGLAVSSTKPLGIRANYALEAREARSTAQFRSILEQDLFQLIDPAPGPDGMAHSLLQLSAARLSPTLASDALIHYVAANQQKDGCWLNTGQSRPPAEDGNFNLTAKAIRALSQYPLAGRKAEFKERAARAAKWLENAEPVNIEDRTFQILGIVWAGHKAPGNRVQELVSLQRADGGWGQTPNLQTDAYATGVALWALHESGIAHSDPVYVRGVNYLLRTQQKDGTWHVVTRSLPFQPYFESGFPYGHDQWISQEGTAFAAIALGFATR